MKTYIGTKIINAKPMNRADYNVFRGWKLPSDENGSDEGYLVEYTDGGKPNVASMDGYVSWSPKEQFDNAYLLIGDVLGYLPHQQRVVAEKAELDDKREKLWVFMNGKNFFILCDESERGRLTRQAESMARYCEALDERIAAFKSNPIMRDGTLADPAKFGVITIDNACRDPSGLTFGGALVALKLGKKVARAGWNGAGLWVTIAGPVTGVTIGYDKFWSGNNAQFAYDQPNSEATVRPYFTIKTADDEIASWAPSVGDCLAEDWMVIA